MNITINNNEMTINTVNDLMAAQSKLLEAFASSIIGTRESIKDEVEKELLDKAGMGSMEELEGWLDEMRISGYIGRDAEQIKERVMEEALSHTSYESLDEMEDEISEMQGVFERIYDEINQYV